MCGVVAVIGKDSASSLVIEGLKKLEYRGYDSSGIASLDNNKLQILKSKGKLNKLIDKFNVSIENQSYKDTKVAIGHTRWATHGNVNIENAHPLVSEDKVAVVHNGIIENYNELKKQLISEGFYFESLTDTEVIPHLFSKYINLGNNLLDAGKLVLNDIKGAFAFVAISSSFPDELFVSRNSSPIAIGLGEGSNFIGSDAQSMSHLTNKIIYLEDGDFALIKSNEVSIFDISLQIVKRKIINFNSDIGLITKSGYRHFMEKEMFEQPSVIPQTISSFLNSKGSINIDLKKLGFTNKSSFTICAAGTSYYAAMIGKYWIEKIANIPVSIDIASEYRYRTPSALGQNCIFVISQSGESLDTLMAMRYAKKLGLHTNAIVNVSGSTIDREADFSLNTNVGPEISVASTKSFTSQLIILFLIAISLGKKFNHIHYDQYVKYLNMLPLAISKMLKLESQIISLANKIKNETNVIFLGRGYLYPLALEGALKLKEISYIHAEGFAAGEMKHGPIALIENGLPVIMFLVADGYEDKSISNLQEAQSRGAAIIVIGDSKSLKKINFESIKIKIPEFNNDFKAIFSPILMAIPAQLLAYHVAREKGSDVDQPRNLAKSVTVE